MNAKTVKLALLGTFAGAAVFGATSTPVRASIAQTVAPPSVPPGGVLPNDTTLRGTLGLMAGSATQGFQDDSVGISFGGYALPRRPVMHIVPVGGAPTTDCPGTVAQPEARRGHLCVYLSVLSTPGSAFFSLTRADTAANEFIGVLYNAQTNAISEQGDHKADKFGFIATVQGSGNSARITARGSWAVTAGKPQ